MPPSPRSPRMDSLAIPSPARRRPVFHNRQSSSGTNNSLRLPSLPRFHPANFATAQSPSSSVAATPATGANTPQQPPLSPRAKQKQYSEMQRQIYLYQQQLMANGARQARGLKPSSPRLSPLDSPGPITPMELEDAEGYLSIGAAGDARLHVERLIQQEVRRQAGHSSGHSVTAGSR